MAFSITSALAAGEDCIKVEKELDRLACYDAALGRTPKVTVEPVVAGSWKVQTSKSKMTDQTDVYLQVLSNEVINCGWNRGARIELYLRCSESTTALMFATGCHMASGHGGFDRIEYRLDKDKARTVRGDASTDNKALGLWTGAKAIPVIKQMLGKSEVVVRMTPYSESPFTATFNVAGLEKAIEPLRKECGW